jgi:hypothetical protein
MPGRYAERAAPQVLACAFTGADPPLASCPAVAIPDRADAHVIF